MPSNGKLYHLLGIECGRSEWLQTDEKSCQIMGDDQLAGGLREMPCGNDPH